MKKLMILFVLGLLRLNCGLKAQDMRAAVVPLDLGEKLPAGFWQQSIAVLDRGKVSKVAMDSFNDRLLVLDFWGRYCAPCIAAMPKMDSLNRKFSGRAVVLPVGDNADAADVAQVLARSRLSSLGLAQGLKSDYLSAFFPFAILPHLVWIYKGHVVGITDGEALDARTVSSVMHIGNDLDSASWANRVKLVAAFSAVLPFKRDRVVKGEVELAGFSDARLARPSGYYYSVFTGQLEGAEPPAGRRVDSIAGTARFSLFNLPLLAYCRLAYDNKTLMDTTVFKLSVASRARYIGPAKGYAAWARANTYCYSVNLPLGIAQQQAREFIRADIRRWLLLLGISLSFEGGENGAKFKIIVSEGGQHG